MGMTVAQHEASKATIRMAKYLESIDKSMQSIASSLEKLREHFEGEEAEAQDPEAVHPHGTVRWFGQSWGAPVNQDAARVDVPVDKPCEACRMAIFPGAQGIGIPEAASGDYLWYHLDCWLRSIGVQVTDEVLGKQVDS